MGKGGGCVPSKKKVPSGVLAADDPTGGSRDAPIPADSAANSNVVPDSGQNDAISEASHPPAAAAAKLRIFIVFYSMYGHVEELARRIKKGVDGVEGVEGVLYRVPETLTAEVLEAMKAPSKDDGIPEISAAELAAADGVLFGFPTRYGCMAAQMKAFFDSTGGLWKEQSLAGKPAGFFVSTGTQGGGQETTA